MDTRRGDYLVGMAVYCRFLFFTRTMKKTICLQLLRVCKRLLTAFCSIPCRCCCGCLSSAPTSRRAHLEASLQEVRKRRLRPMLQNQHAGARTRVGQRGARLRQVRGSGHPRCSRLLAHNQAHAFFPRLAVPTLTTSSLKSS